MTERLNHALALIQAQARPQELAGMARFGLVGDGRLGLAVPAMRRIARELGPDHDLALALWAQGFPDARIVASMVAQPAKLTVAQMDAWAKGLVAWDVCDQACTNAFCRTPLAWGRVRKWATRQDEFVRRAAFSLIAALSVHAKTASDAQFIALLPLIEAAAQDERNFVKKAVNWALRNIGKRNPALHASAVQCAQRIRAQGSRSARWIAADALRELNSEAVMARMQVLQATAA